jgi:hypothetical protein
LYNSTAAASNMFVPYGPAVPVLGLVGAVSIGNAAAGVISGGLWPTLPAGTRLLLVFNLQQSGLETVTIVTAYLSAGVYIVT